MPRSCENPDCENLVHRLRSHQIRIGKSVLCSTNCKKSFLLWVMAAARQRFAEDDVLSSERERLSLLVSLPRPWRAALIQTRDKVRGESYVKQNMVVRRS
jgi:hypothetical protein